MSFCELSQLRRGRVLCLPSGSDPTSNEVNRSLSIGFSGLWIQPVITKPKLKTAPSLGTHNLTSKRTSQEVAHTLSAEELCSTQSSTQAVFISVENLIPWSHGYYHNPSLLHTQGAKCSRQGESHPQAQARTWSQPHSLLMFDRSAIIMVKGRQLPLQEPICQMS